MSTLESSDINNYEIWLAPSISPKGEVQLRVAPHTNEPDMYSNPEAADQINRELAVTGLQDAEAKVIALLYAGQPVPEELFGGVVDAKNNLDPAVPLMNAIGKLTDDDASQAAANRFNTLGEILDGVGQNLKRKRFMFIGRTGLVVGSPAGADTAVMSVEDLTDDEVTLETARQLDLDDVALGHEVIYKEDEFGTRPELRSFLEHYVLGKLVDGEFHPVVTVLCPEHPLRQGVEAVPIAST